MFFFEVLEGKVFVELLFPQNNSKVFPANIINFSWTITNESSQESFECNVFINDTFINSTTCLRDEITSLEIEVPFFSRNLNWSVEAVNSSITAQSNISKFQTVFQRHVSLRKELEFDSSGLYFTRIELTNTMNTPLNFESSIFSFIQEPYSFGSQSPPLSNLFSPAGEFSGEVLRWDFDTIDSQDSQMVSYLLATSKNQNATLLGEYVVGFR